MYKAFIRPILFLLPAEKAHHFTFSIFGGLMKIPGLSSIVKANFRNRHKSLERELWGITFPNPVGLAAGFDKDAKLYRELSALGFGFIEIGTITPKGQPGNPQPRLFRLPKDKALVNRMGFNNEGVEAAIERLKKKPKGLIVGGNIGKNKVTPNENATDDYLISFRALHKYVDYFVVNVSSPNTPNLRELQDKEPLKRLLVTLQAENKTFDAPKPILLKIAPDLTDGQLNDIIDLIQEINLDGLIATNTTIDRSGLQTPDSEVEAIGAGGLSGMPLEKRATEVIKYISDRSNKAFPIIAVGGIFSAEDALAKLEAGADLVQLYTGFIYEGPTLIKRINKALIKGT
ncbi:MAG: dihydroorotate dehydrogenase (quinone) [Flavobacteriales bacterium]|nr:dihydroorotate dehydrogenase (quinone) [Flavobacteriales bacterium]